MDFAGIHESDYETLFRISEILKTLPTWLGILKERRLAFFLFEKIKSAPTEVCAPKTQTPLLSHKTE